MPLGKILEHDPGEVSRAVRRAAGVQPGWDALPFREKAFRARRAADWIYSNADRIAEIISACTGKTRIDSLSTEVLPGALAWRYYARTAKKVLKPEKIGPSSLLFFNKRSILYRVPYGVVGIISPWNYPFGIPLHEAASALLAGNGVVLKVATQVQPVGELLAEMVRSAGFPEGLFSLVHLPGSRAGREFIESGIGKLFFIGSTEVGKRLMEEAARRLLPVNLELGGNDGMIVLRDANLSRAASGALWAGLSNCGQSCAGVERIFVESPVYEEFLRLLKEGVSALRHGPDLDFDSDIGALTGAEQKIIVEKQLAEALDSGARIAAASRATEAVPADGGGNFHPAMIVEAVRDDAALMTEETFGPLLAVKAVDNADEAVRLVNESRYGLTASVWSADPGRAREIASRIEAGVVTINDHLMSHGMAETPWGGFKDSGIGRSHGASGILEKTREKVVIQELLPMLPRNIWWYPHSRRVYDGLKSAMDMLFAASPFKKISGLGRLARFYLGRLKR